VGTLACLRGCNEGLEAQRCVVGAFAGFVFPNRVLPDVERKRNKKVAVKLLLRGLTVPHLALCSPTHHSPSAL
jgi:hypothetical protein